MDERRPAAATRGGILLDAFLIVALLAAGGFVWYLWRQKPFFSVDKIAALARFRKQAPAAPAASASGDSAWVQTRVRDVLARHGVREREVLKTYNREHKEDGPRWLEDTLEVKYPASFDGPRFRLDVEELLRSRGLSVLNEKKKDRDWTLELGRDGRVYERIVFKP